MTTAELERILVENESLKKLLEEEQHKTRRLVREVDSLTERINELTPNRDVIPASVKTDILSKSELKTISVYIRKVCFPTQYAYTNKSGLEVYRVLPVGTMTDAQYKKFVSIFERIIGILVENGHQEED